MKTIVLAHPKDDHAAPVQWALQQSGYQADCWSGVSSAEQERASLFPGECPKAVLGTYELEKDDVVWLRQPQQSIDNPTGTGEVFSRSSYSAFFRSIASMLETLPVRCINPFSSSCMARNKAVQLHLARAAGLNIPQTLMTNSPQAVRGFFHQHPNGAICKAFGSHVWQQQDSKEIAVTETFSLGREQLPSDEVLTYAPAIYQQRVTKLYDVRMVLMGEKIYSHSLHTPGNLLDWRCEGALNGLIVETIHTPPDVEEGVLRLAQKAGICFGVMDFAIDRHGDWWFLEINEQGQFFWLEQLCPQARLLQKFCSFLARAGEKKENLFPSFADYQQSHRQHEVMNVTGISAESLCKSVEP